MDTIVVLDNGRIADQGTFEEVQQRSAGLIAQAEASLEVDEESSKIQSATEEGPLHQAQRSLSETDDSNVQEGGEGRQSGNWSVYAYYCKSAGALSMFLWVLGTMLGAVFGSITCRFCFSPCDQP